MYTFSIFLLYISLQISIISPQKQPECPGLSKSVIAIAVHTHDVPDKNLRTINILVFGFLKDQAFRFLFGEYCLFTKECWRKNCVQGLNIPCMALQSLLSREKGGAISPFLNSPGLTIGTWRKTDDGINFWTGAG